MSFLAAIVGLALLVLIHESGHFFAARAVGMKPRKFYLGFGRPIVSRVHNGVEYAIGTFPLGGYVKIPGMSRPEPGSLAALLRPDVARAHKLEIDRLDAAIASGDEDRARAELNELKPKLGETRAWQEMDGALSPDAYWREKKTWKRVFVIAAGPGVNLIFAVLLFTVVFMIASRTSQTTNVVGQTLPNTPASRAGLHAGDEIVRIAGKPVDPARMASQIRATDGRPFTLVLKRGGKQVVVKDIAAQEVDGAYRIGIAIEGKLGPGESLPAAALDAVKETWFEVRGTAVALGNLVSARHTNQLSGPIGIVRIESSAWRSGARQFVAILGSISLALGLFNLLPVLPFDGGYIGIALIEKFRGRTFGQGVYMRYMLVGLAVVLLVAYISFRNDLGLGG